MEKQSKKDIILEIIRFLIVGGIATLCDYAVFYLFNLVILKNLDKNLNLVIATALGFLTGLIVNWFLQKFVYRYITDNETKSKWVFVKFVIVSLIGLGLTELGINLASPLYGKYTWEIIVKFDPVKLFFKCLMTGIVLVWNYIARKLFVFKTKKVVIEDTTEETIEDERKD